MNALFLFRWLPYVPYVSERQLEILVDFAETHRDVSMNRFAGGPLGNQAARQAWEGIALTLNSVGNGTTKSWEQWRRYWIELKAKVKNKAADSRRMARGTGGGPNRLLPLTPLEEKIIAIIGPVAVEGLPGVQIPLNASTSTDLGAEPTGDTPNIGGPSHPNLEQVEAGEASPFVLVVPELDPAIQEQPEVIVSELQPSVQEQPEAAVQEQASQDEVSQTRENRQTQRSTRRDRLRQIRRDTNLLSWAYQLEVRRLEVEGQHADALTQIGHALEQQAAALSRMANALERILCLLENNNVV